MKYILLVLLFFLSFQTGFVANNPKESSLELRQEIYSQVPKGKIYVQTIDFFIAGISTNEIKLNRILGKVVDLETWLNASINKTQKEEYLLMLVSYIKYSILSELTPLMIDDPASQAFIVDPESPDEEKEPEIEAAKIHVSDVDILDISEQEFEQKYSPKSKNDLEETIKNIYKKQWLSEKSARKKLEEQVEIIEEYYDVREQEKRDEKRKSHLSDIQNALEKYYKDTGRYPSYKLITSELDSYIRKLPTDSMWGIRKNNCRFWYFYEVWNDSQNYRLSSCMETGNFLQEAANDSGIDISRYEIGSNISYEGKGVDYIKNSDIFYFSLVDQNSDGWPIQQYSSWVSIPEQNQSWSRQKVFTLLNLEYQKDNPWIDKNLVAYNIMNIIASSMDSYFLNGTILDVINHTSVYSWENIAVGAPLIQRKNYKTGTINYEELGLKKDFPKSPLGQSFLVWYADTWWGHYQVMSLFQEKTQNGNAKKVSIRGTYTPKNATLIERNDYRIISDTEIEVLDSQNIRLFWGSDFINNEHEIWWVNYDTDTIKTLQPLPIELKEINVRQPEGLLFDPVTKKPYINGQVIEIR